MTKAKAQQDPALDLNDAKPAARRGPLDAFVHHQAKAVEETGKALASLLPKEFRTHAGKAIDESCASFEALFDGVIENVESGLHKLRSKPQDEAGKEKVQVDID